MSEILQKTEPNTTQSAPITSAPQDTKTNVIQWNLRNFPSDKKDEIILKATREHSLSVNDYIILKCLNFETTTNNTNEVKTTAPVVQNNDIELDELNALVAKLRKANEDLIFENSELKQAIKNVPVVEAIEPALVNEFAFKTYPELAECLVNVEAYRKEKGLKPLNNNIQEILYSYGGDLYNDAEFKDNFGIEFRQLKALLKVSDTGLYGFGKKFDKTHFEEMPTIENPILNEVKK